MKKTTFLFAVLIATIFMYSCKKDSQSTTDVADSYVGIWNAKDTVYDDADFTIYLNSENSSFSISKKDANHVNISNMLGIPGTTVWAVTSNALSYVSGASGSDEDYLSSFVGMKNGNKINYTIYGDTRGVAIKQ